MRIMVNGTAREITAETLAEALVALGQGEETVATALNEEFVPAAARAGTALAPGDWIEIDQGRINTFADCTEDHQFIHVDEAAAKETPFGTTIAHGFKRFFLALDCHVNM